MFIEYSFNFSIYLKFSKLKIGIKRNLWLPETNKSVRISEGHEYIKALSKIKSKSQWFSLSLVYFLWQLISDFYLTNKWLKVIPWEYNVHANSTKGILCNTYKWHVAMHLQVSCGCVGWIGPNRVQVKNNCVLSLCSECTINPSPGWNFRQFLEPG